jgi:hypothetical protein
VVAIGAIFCFVAAAAAYLAFDVSGQSAGNAANGSTTIKNVADSNVADTVQPGAAGVPAAPFGCVNGMATDKNKNGMPDVTVTLWEVRLDNATGTYVNVGLADVENNPRVSWGEQDGNATGDYVFFNVPLGTYNLTAEKDGHMACSLVNVTRGTAIMNLDLPGIIYVDPATMIHANASDLPVTVGRNDTRPGFIPSDDGKLWCTIAGAVIDRISNGIPGAEVTLRACHDDGTGRFVNDRPAAVDNNPQAANSYGTADPVGYYRYDMVPFGCYNVTASKVDAAGMCHTGSVIVNATLGGIYTANVSIKDLIIGP